MTKVPIRMPCVLMCRLKRAFFRQEKQDKRSFLTIIQISVNLLRRIYLAFRRCESSKEIYQRSAIRVQSSAGSQTLLPHLSAVSGVLDK